MQANTHTLSHPHNPHPLTGKYLNGLDAESLRISVWKGDVELRNLTLKPEALQDLDLPCTVKAGLLGRLTLKVQAVMIGCVLMCIYRYLR